MSGKPHFKAQQIANMLIETKGMVFIAAEKLGCSHQTIYNYVKKHPMVRRAKEKQDGIVVDAAELHLYKAIQEGEQWAIQFILKTKGKSRGYFEKSENANIDLDLSHLTDAQLVRLANGEDVYSILTTKG
jgi:hypothetical protein